MRRAFFFIVAVCLATPSFASIPRASAPDLSSPSFDALSETRIRVSDDLAPFERPAPSLLSRALRQAYEQASTTNASGLAGFLSVDPGKDWDPRRPQSWNLYSYTRNNPVNFSDPTGRYLGASNEQLAAAHDAMTPEQREQFAQAQETGFKITGAVALAFVPGPEDLVLGGWALKAGVRLLGKFVGKGDEVVDTVKAVDKMTDASPTAGRKVDSKTRQRILDRDQKADGSWDCATCGQNTTNTSNIHTGHIQPRSRGGDLSDGNLRCEGAACNLSQGNRAAPKPGRTCADRGGCGAPYGRTD